jgi:hypothetical protein
MIVRVGASLIGYQELIARRFLEADYSADDGPSPVCRRIIDDLFLGYR